MNERYFELAEENRRLRKALKWYSEKAESIARYGKEGKHTAAEACLTELLIDGGVRACKALKGKK